MVSQLHRPGTALAPKPTKRAICPRYTAVADAVRQNLATEAQLDAVVSRSLALRMRTGMFDPLADQVCALDKCDALISP